MTTPIGVSGGILVAAEAVAYATEGASYITQHGVGSTLGLRRAFMTHDRVQFGARTVSDPNPTYVDGEFTVAWDPENDVMAPILGNMGTLSTLTYTIGGSAAKTYTSITVQVNHGGTAYIYKGCKITRATWNFPANGNATLACQVIGQSKAKKGSPSTITLPTEAGIVMPSEFGSLTINSVACLFRGMTITVDFPHTGADRAAAGGTAIKEPIPTAPPKVTGTINVELDDATGENTVGILDTFIASGTLATIALGSTFSIATCKMTGETPAWRPGLQEFPIQFESFGALTVVTT